MNYGLTYFHPESVGTNLFLPDPIAVTNGQSDQVFLSVKTEKKELLLSDQDSFTMDVLLPSSLEAPVQARSAGGNRYLLCQRHCSGSLPHCQHRTGILY